MSWVVNKLREYSNYYVPISIGGIIAYPIALYGFLNSNDDALREAFNRQCNTNYARGDKWGRLKRELIRKDPSGWNPFKDVRYRADNFKQVLKAFGWEPTAWYMAQEAAYFAAVVPLQVEAGLYVNDRGGGWFSSVGLNLLAGSLASWVRRTSLLWYVDRNTRAIFTPTPEMCELARDIERAPAPAPVTRRVMDLFRDAVAYLERLPRPEPKAIVEISFFGAAVLIIKSLLDGVATAAGVFVPPGVLRGIERDLDDNTT